MKYHALPKDDAQEDGRIQIGDHRPDSRSCKRRLTISFLSPRGGGKGTTADGFESRPKKALTF